MRRTLIGLLALFPALALVGAVPAHAAPAAAIHDLRGHFAAFTGTLGGPDTRAGTLDITTQLGPVVLGRADLAGRAFTVSGTISPAGDVNLAGLGGPDTLTVQTHLVDDLGPVGVGDPDQLEGTYQLSSLLGGSRAGQLVAIQLVPTTGAPSIGGNWAGRILEPTDLATHLGRARATFAQSDKGTLTGRLDAVLFNPQPDPPGFQFTMGGQAQVDQNQFSSYLLAGSADGALMTMRVRAVQAGPSAPITALAGLLRLHFADGSVQDTFVQLQPVPTAAAA